MAVVSSNKPIHIGLDIGQISDPTAISVVEVQQMDRGRQRFLERGRTRLGQHGITVHLPDLYEPVYETDYTLRHIERLPLGTSYPNVARRVADVLASEQMQGRYRRVFVDVTGVGRPVYEMIVQEAARRPTTQDVEIKPISFVHGQNYNEREGKLGKAYLVSRLQALLQDHLVHAPDTPEVRVMLEELRVYEIKIDQDGHDTYGAFKVGTHDDLATALGLAVIEDPFAGTIEPLDWETASYLQNFTGW